MGNLIVENILFFLVVVLLFDFLLTRNNVNIVKRYLLVNLTVSLILIIIKSYIVFLFSLMFSIFFYLIAFMMSVEEKQKESPQNIIVDIGSIICLLLMFGFSGIVFYKNLDSPIVNELFKNTDLEFVNRFNETSSQIIMLIFLILILLISTLAKMGKLKK